MPWRAGALVSVSPDLIYVEDRDGDGVADHREVLWSGFSEDNPQHRMSGFTYGLDNWLYLAGGTSHRAIRNVKTGETTTVSRRDIRIHPGQRRLELISGQSQYGRCRDDWGNWFGNNNTEPLYHFAIEDAFLARNPYAASPSPRVSMTTPARAPRVFPTSRTVDRFNDLFALDRFTSACAPHVFRDVTMGPDVSGAVFICEPVHNLVSRVMLRPDGVTFRGERHSSEAGSEFLSSSDNWFRPVHCQTGPDGTLWVVDMYRMVIEHPEWIPESWQAKLNLYAGNNKGRIYRIRPVGGAAGKILDLTTDSPVELTRKLDHSNGWVRDTAQRLLIERDDPESIGPLRRTLRESDNPLALLHALWTLEGLESLRDADLLAAFQSEHAGVVRAAVTIGGLRSLGGTDFHPAILAEHPDISVRYAVALAAGDSKDLALQLQVLKTIADQDLKDPWLRAAIVSSSTSCADELLAHVLKTAEPTPQRSVLASQLIATALAKDLAAGTSGLLATIIPPSSGGIKDPIEVWQLSAIGDLLDALANRGSSIRKLAATPALQSQIELASGRALATARTVAADQKAPIHAHLAAVRLLGRGVRDPAPDIDLLRSFLSPRMSTEVQSTAIETLSAIDQPQVLIAAMNSLTPKLRSEIQGILMTRPKGAGLLLDAIENKSILPTDLDAATRSSFIAYPSGAVRERAEKLLSDALQDRREVTEQFRESLDLEGDAQRGRELFTKRCAACHRLQKLGNEVGPQLSALQNKSREYLLTAILNPNQAVEAKYKVYTIATRQGVIYSGMIIDESATAITLARADGKKTTVLRLEIDEIASGLSFMPEGLEKDLTLQDLADLLTFVQGESQQRETPP
jgi:putative membrane-bound dehydrogenase-like protein